MDLKLAKLQLRCAFKSCEQCKQKGKTTRAKHVHRLPLGRYELLCNDCFYEAVSRGNKDFIEYR